MNITLATDQETIRRTREYARQHGTSLNHLVRDFLRSLTAGAGGDQAAAEFRRNATAFPGRSPEGYRFNREEAQRMRG